MSHLCVIPPVFLYPWIFSTRHFCLCKKICSILTFGCLTPINIIRANCIKKEYNLLKWICRTWKYLKFLSYVVNLMKVILFEIVTYPNISGKFLSFIHWQFSCLATWLVSKKFIFFSPFLCKYMVMWLPMLFFVFQRFWRNYLKGKQVRAAAVQKVAFVMESAATFLQASWRAHLERQRYLELRAAVIVIQQRWRNLCRHRHRAATCIQARWKGYKESKRYQEQRNAIILLQSTCRGFAARQR